MSRLTVTVVTPSYNQGKFLGQTIESVLGQDYPAIEYRVLDGGSTDDSVEVLRRYAPRLAFWTSGKDRGQADAINRGWRESKGEIVAYLNADDRYERGAVARAVETFERHPETGVVYGSCFSDIEGAALERLHEPPDFSIERLLVENFIPQPTVFLRRSVIERVGPLDESLHYCMDYDLWLRAAAAGFRFRRVPGPALARFRVWLGSKTSQDPDGWVEEKLRALDKAFASSASSGWRKLRPYADARAFVTGAYGVAMAGNRSAGLRFLCAAARRSPRVLGDSQTYGVAAMLLLGNRGTSLVRKLKWGLRPRRRAATC